MRQFRFRAPQRNFDAMSSLSKASKLGATQDERDAALKKRYMQLAMEVHPDRNPDDKNAQENFVALAQAYAMITGLAASPADWTVERVFESQGW